MFTPEEKKFLLQILSQSTINPAQPEAKQIVETIQAILAKLTVINLKKQNGETVEK